MFAAALASLAVLLAACAGSSDAEPAPPAPAPAAESNAPQPELELARGLTEGPLEPSDPTLFAPPYCPASPVFPPAEAELGEGEAVARALALVEHHDPARIEEARAVFDDPALSLVVPDHALRAGLASLTGTLAEPVIAWVATSFARVEFGTPGEGAAARSIEVEGEQVIIVGERFRFEDPGLLGVLLTHEALHSDAAISDFEELIAFAIQALVHMEQIVADPSLATQRTELAQQLNPWVLARLNTRVPGSSELRLLLPDFAPSIFPGGVSRPYFAVLFDPNAESTPGNALLARLAGNVANAEVAPPDDLRFSIAAVGLLDAGQDAISDDELIAVARALDLRPGGV